MPSKQETFNRVAAALIAQGRPSMNEKMECLYRNGDLRCAAGHLLPDDRYKPEFEGHSVNPDYSPPDVCDQNEESEFINDRPSFIKAQIEVTAVFTDEGHDLALVNALQDAHDFWGMDAMNVASLDDLLRRLADVAETHDLAFPGI